jgi:hypothetical protein
MALGVDTSPATPAVSGPDGNGIYTHTYKVGRTMPFYTGEFQAGGVAGAVTLDRFDGICCDRLSLSGKAALSSAEGLLRGKATLLARRRTKEIAATALTLSNPRGVLYKHAVTVDDGSADAAADVRVRGWGIDLISPLTRDRFYFSNQPYSDQWLRDKMFRAEWTFEQEWQTQTQYDNFIANADLSPKMVFEGPETIGASGKRSISIESNKTRIMDLSPPTDKFGVLVKTLKQQALYNVADLSGVIVIVKSTEATIALG